MWLVNRKNYKEWDDPSLVKAFRDKGDSQALGVLFERYSHLVFGVCMKYLRDTDESKDATMAIFEKLQEDLKRFDVQKFNFWIHRVAKNHCLMILRSRKHVLRVDSLDGSGWDRVVESAQEMHPVETIQHEEKLRLMEEAIENLNVEQRICIELFYLKKHCYQDVSEISGFSMNEVKSYIQNGKRNIKLYMLKKNHEYPK